MIGLQGDDTGGVLVNISLQKGNAWESLGDLKVTGFAESRFGFNVPGGQQLHLAYFDARGFR